MSKSKLNRKALQCIKSQINIGICCLFQHALFYSIILFVGYQFISVPTHHAMVKCSSTRKYIAAFFKTQIHVSNNAWMISLRLHSSIWQLNIRNNSRIQTWYEVVRNATFFPVLKYFLIVFLLTLVLYMKFTSLQICSAVCDYLTFVIAFCSAQCWIAMQNLCLQYSFE